MKEANIVSCFDGQMEVTLPGDVEMASEEKVIKKFPYDDKPQETYMNYNGEKIITFNLLDKQLSDIQVNPAIREIQRMIGHIYPESIHRQAVCIRIDAGKLGWFSFVTGGLSKDHIHILFILSVLDSMMVGSFHFPTDCEQEGIEEFYKMVKSIKVNQNAQEELKKGYVGNRI